MRRAPRIVVVAGLMVLVASGGPATAQAPAPEPDEGALLQAIAERPADPQPFVALTRYYYERRQLERATRTLSAALTVARDEDARPAPPPPEPGVYRAGIDVPRLVKTRDERPRIPVSLQRDGVVGVVVVDAAIDEEGRVTGARVVESVPRLDEPVMNAVERWRFEPVLVEGRAVPVTAFLAVDVTYRTEPEPHRDLALSQVYLRSYLYPQAEALLARALGAIRDELACWGPDAVAAGRPRASDMLSPDQIDPFRLEPPIKGFHVEPRYPAAALLSRVQGVVILETLVDLQGRVRCVRVEQSVPMLDQAAIDAVRQWRYVPPRLDGRATEMHLTVAVSFRLREPHVDFWAAWCGSCHMFAPTDSSSLNASLPVR